MLKIFYGTIKNGKISLEEKDKFESYLQDNDSREIGLYINFKSDIRTTAENRYYWGVIVKMVSDEMGIIPDEAHDFLKSLFLKVGVEHQGKRYEIIKSTTGLSINEFEDYCQKCRDWASVELNCPIPLPNEVEIKI